LLLVADSDEISRLSVDERLELIGQLSDSLEHEPLPLSTAQQQELDRRLATLDEDRAQGGELGGAPQRARATLPVRLSSD
jgi:putative addiction module component (TIGR02574 family)